MSQIKEAQKFYNHSYRVMHNRRRDPSFDIVWRYERRRLDLAMITYLEKLMPQKIIEVGIGKGDSALRMSKQMESQAMNYVGIDISIEGVRIANERIRNQSFHFLAANGIYLPFKSNGFDVVVCSEVIEHVMEKKKLLLEIKRVLKPGGHLILTTPNARSLTHILPRAVNKTIGFDIFHSHQIIEEQLEYMDLTRMLESTFFSISDYRGLVFYPFVFNRLEKLFKKPLVPLRSVSECFENIFRLFGSYQVILAENKTMRNVTEGRKRRLLRKGI